MDSINEEIIKKLKNCITENNFVGKIKISAMSADFMSELKFLISSEPTEINNIKNILSNKKLQNIEGYHLEETSDDKVELGFLTITYIMDNCTFSTY